MSNNPIGIFDSGVGGLSVARSIRALLPNEKIIYIADSFYAPYGEKPEQFILKRSSQIIDYLISQKIKILVVACNTATVTIIDMLRDKYSIPIIGVEPGIKPAVTISKSGKIGVLATEQTINSCAFNDLVNRFINRACIETQACKGLVELVESNQLDGVEINSALKKYVTPMLDTGVDTIVMGCTHYAFLTKNLREIIGREFKVINTYKAVANETLRRLNENHLLTSSSVSGSEIFFSSNIQKNTALLFEKLWGKPVSLSAFKK